MPLKGYYLLTTQPEDEIRKYSELMQTEDSVAAIATILWREHFYAWKPTAEFLGWLNYLWRQVPYLTVGLTRLAAHSEVQLLALSRVDAHRLNARALFLQKVERRVNTPAEQHEILEWAVLYPQEWRGQERLEEALRYQIHAAVTMPGDSLISVGTLFILASDLKMLDREFSDKMRRYSDECDLSSSGIDFAAGVLAAQELGLSAKEYFPRIRPEAWGWIALAAMK